MLTKDQIKKFEAKIDEIVKKYEHAQKHGKGGFTLDSAGIELRNVIDDIRQTAGDPETWGLKEAWKVVGEYLNKHPIADLQLANKFRETAKLGKKSADDDDKEGEGSARSSKIKNDKSSRL